jgi:hypothetical protein
LSSLDLGPFALPDAEPIPPAESGASAPSAPEAPGRVGEEPSASVTPAAQGAVAQGAVAQGAAAQLSVPLTAEPDAPPAAADSAERLTPTQRRTHGELLSVGTARPFSPPKLADQLRQLIEERTAATLASWTESSLFLTKSRLASTLTCEAKATAEMATPWTGTIHPATAVGTVAHRAIQIAHTHPGHPVASYVESAISASVRHDTGFAEFYTTADLGTQSDLMSQAASRVTLFLDSWPQLAPAWSPRFEESLQAKIGRLTLSARPDLILGRPKADGRRTVFMCDFKTGSLSERHDTEALFYALVATLRHGMVPFRSSVYSLASAEWVAPELDAVSLTAIATQVADAAVALVEVGTDTRPATLTPGPHCSWCPLARTCEASLVRTVAEDLPPAPAAPEQW